jgi:P27 family predicted phage terminase small subunit
VVLILVWMVRIVAPKHLSARSKRIYRSVVDDYDLARELHALEVLRLGLEALDRAEEAREIIAREGMTYSNRFGEPRAHPAVAVERDCRVQVARLFRELSLDAGDYDDSRPPRVGSGALA